MLRGVVAQPMMWRLLTVVLIGIACGADFDVKDTSYTLNAIGEGTELTIDMGYRVTTQFNWYAEPLARLLLGNFEEVVLEFYRRRSESVNLSVQPRADERGR